MPQTHASAAAYRGRHHPRRREPRPTTRAFAENVFLSLLLILYPLPNIIYNSIKNKKSLKTLLSHVSSATITTQQLV